MQIDLNGQAVALIGETNPIAEAALAALLANGGRQGDTPDVLLVSLPLLPAAGIDVRPLLAVARTAAERMAAGDGGRILFLLSAVAGMPMRRHPDFSAAMAGAQAGMRAAGHGSRGHRHGAVLLRPAQHLYDRADAERRRRLVGRIRPALLMLARTALPVYHGGGRGGLDGSQI